MNKSGPGPTLFGNGGAGVGRNGSSPPGPPGSTPVEADIFQEVINIYAFQWNKHWWITELQPQQDKIASHHKLLNNDILDIVHEPMDEKTKRTKILRYLYTHHEAYLDTKDLSIKAPNPSKEVFPYFDLTPSKDNDMEKSTSAENSQGPQGPQLVPEVGDETRTEAYEPYKEVYRKLNPRNIQDKHLIQHLNQGLYVQYSKIGLGSASFVTGVMAIRQSASFREFFNKLIKEAKDLAHPEAKVHNDKDFDKYLQDQSGRSRQPTGPAPTSSSTFGHGNAPIANDGHSQQQQITGTGFGTGGAQRGRNIGALGFA
jgi:hypothetical protein